MALDEALMARARRTGETVMRVYDWPEPVLSLGRNQTARGIYDESRLESEGVEVVRRPTGGRALLHHREITYSVTAPVISDEGLGQVYRRINRLLAEGLATLGVPVEPAVAAGRAASPTAAPCFAEPAAGELVLQGRKLVGSAQWRDDGALLQHGSILLEDDQSRIPSLMRVPAETPPAPATLRSVLGRSPSLAEVSGALFGAVMRFADAEAEPLAEDEQLRRDAERLLERYRDPAWTWRR